MVTAGSSPTTQASWPGGKERISPGPASTSLPSAMRMWIRPLTWYCWCAPCRVQCRQPVWRARSIESPVGSSIAQPGRRQQGWQCQAASSPPAAPRRACRTKRARTAAVSSMTPRSCSVDIIKVAARQPSLECV